MEEEQQREQTVEAKPQGNAFASPEASPPVPPLSAEDAAKQKQQDEEQKTHIRVELDQQKQNTEGQTHFPTEQEVWRDGFTSYHTVLQYIENKDARKWHIPGMARMVLTKPEIASGIIGTQPLVAIHSGEATCLYQAFKDSGQEFQKGYDFLPLEGTLDKQTNNSEVLLVNEKAVEHALRTNAEALQLEEHGIALPADKQLSKDEILTCVTQLLNNPDTHYARFAHELLSGNSPEESRRTAYPETGSAIEPFPKLQKMGSVQAYERSFGNGGIGRIGYITDLIPSDYEANASDTQRLLSSEAFRKLDQELGISDFIQQQRNAVDVKANTKLIQQHKATADKAYGDFKSTEETVKKVNARFPFIKGTVVEKILRFLVREYYSLAI